MKEIVHIASLRTDREIKINAPVCFRSGNKYIKITEEEKCISYYLSNSYSSCLIENNLSLFFKTDYDFCIEISEEEYCEVVADFIDKQKQFLQ